MTIRNSTVSNNWSFEGGGIFSGSGWVTITNTTVIGNQEGLGGSGMQAANSIFAENGVNCANIGGVLDDGGNFADDSSCGGGFAPITPGVDIEVTLADNGGPTQTHALLPGSVAIDAAGECGLDRDQRGAPRNDGACDSGSFEFTLCGNGTVDPGEECDDGDNIDGDGCAFDCTVEQDVPATTGIGVILLVLALGGATAYFIRRRTTT
jgi:cysteine-rich repeat protein